MFSLPDEQFIDLQLRVAIELWTDACNFVLKLITDELLVENNMVDVYNIAARSAILHSQKG